MSTAVNYRPLLYTGFLLLTDKVSGHLVFTFSFIPATTYKTY